MQKSAKQCVCIVCVMMVKRDGYLANAVAKMINYSTFWPVRKIKNEVTKIFKTKIIQKTTDDCSIAFLIRKDEETSKYNEQSFEEKCELLLVNHKAKNAKYSLKKREEFLALLQSPMTFAEISEKSGVKTNWYLTQRLKQFVKAKLIDKIGDTYQTAIIF